MTREGTSGFLRLTALALVLLAAQAAQALIVSYDYTYDTNNFFSLHPQAVDVLMAAADAFAAFDDQLAAIEPDPPADRWRAYFYNPGTGNTQQANNLPVPADTVIVYVGGRDLPGYAVGEAGPGGYSANGSTEFVNTVAYRGQTGAADIPATDFGPWGGSMAFDTGTNWNYSVASPPTPSQVDFYSVVVHELAHVLGFGLSDSWDACISGLYFTGTVSTAVYGANAPLDSGLGHWADGTTGHVSGVEQETAMDPVINYGARKYFTDLDYAGLIDVGWEYPPPGDANADGKINGADYTIWADNFHASPVPPASAGGWTVGNFNEDNIVDGADYTVWADGYARPGAPASAGDLAQADALGGADFAISADFHAPGPLQSSIPEPGALSVLLAGAGLLARQRRR